jgi:hypothetical protein
VDFGEQASGCLQFAVDERHIEDQLCSVIRNLSLPLGLDLAL